MLGLKERGYSSVPLSELEGAEPLGLKGLPRRLVGILDDLFDRASGIRRVAGRRDTLFRVGQAKFPLPGVLLRDGQMLKTHAPVLEFHVNNPLMVDRDLRAGLRQARLDLRLLARDIQADPQWREAQALFCISALKPLLESLGFETHELPSPVQRRLGIWARVLRRAYGTRVETQPQPVLSVLGMRAFLERYGD